MFASIAADPERGRHGRCRLGIMYHSPPSAAKPALRSSVSRRSWRVLTKPSIDNLGRWQSTAPDYKRLESLGLQAGVCSVQKQHLLFGQWISPYARLHDHDLMPALHAVGTGHQVIE